MHKRVSSALDLRTTDYSKLNAREKKIVEHFPKTTKDELEKLSNQIRNQGVSRNTDINKNNYLTAQTTYHTCLYSNIFNDPVNN